MKRQTKLLPCYLIGLLVMAVSVGIVCTLLANVPKIGQLHWILRLLPAILFMLMALVAHWLAKGKTWAYLISYYLNAAGSGWAIGILIAAKGFVLSQELLLGMVPAVILGILLVLFMNSPSEKRRFVSIAVFSVLALVLIGVGIYFVCAHRLQLGYAFLFSGLYFLPLPLGYECALSDQTQMFRCLSFTGFGAFVLILFVVVFILSEGEILDGLDFDFGGGGGSAKKKRGK